MAQFELADDGTMDTALDCNYCSKRLYYRLVGTEEEREEAAIALAKNEHECDVADLKNYISTVLHESDRDTLVGIIMDLIGETDERDELVAWVRMFILGEDDEDA